MPESPQPKIIKPGAFLGHGAVVVVIGYLVSSEAVNTFARSTVYLVLWAWIVWDVWQSVSSRPGRGSRKIAAVVAFGMVMALFLFSVVWHLHVAQLDREWSDAYNNYQRRCNTLLTPQRSYGRLPQSRIIARRVSTRIIDS